MIIWSAVFAIPKYGGPSEHMNRIVTGSLSSNGKSVKRDTRGSRNIQRIDRWTDRNLYSRMCLRQYVLC